MSRELIAGFFGNMGPELSCSLFNVGYCGLPKILFDFRRIAARLEFIEGCPFVSREGAFFLFG